MKLSLAAGLAGLVLAACAAPASAAIVSVLGTSSPWDPTVMGNGFFGTDGATGAVSILVNGGDSITIDYLDGLTGSFGPGTEIATAEGYVDGVFGSGQPSVGPPLTGQGFFTPLPSFYIDPTNTGSPIWLNALLGSFVDASGHVLGTSFATGNDPFMAVAPTGAVALLLGLNDDNFGDNPGALRVSVTGSSVIAGVPEPTSWALMITGFGLSGALLRRRRGALA
jgi:hypothetical protein